MARLRPILDGMGISYEVVGIDDGSTDATPMIMQKIRQEWPELRIVRFARNSGHQAALTAGIHRAYGEYVVSIDADLQDPPEKIVEMYELAREKNLDIVYGVRGDRGTDTFFKRRTAGVYYWLMRKLVGKNMPNQAGDFRLLSRAAVDALKSCPSTSRSTGCWCRGSVSPAVRSSTSARSGSPAAPITRCPRWSAWPSTASPTSPRARCGSPPGSVC